jgi:hypothetical protein
VDIVNVVTYMNANFQRKIFLLWTTKKMIKSDKIWRFENLHTQIHTSCCVTKNSKYLKLYFTRLWDKWVHLIFNFKKFI